jgi:acyl carrier protein
MVTEFGDRSHVYSVLVAGIRLIRPDLAERPISGDEHLVAELGLDSIARVELLVAVEEQFHIEDEIDPRIFLAPVTLNDLVDQIVVEGGITV